MEMHNVPPPTTTLQALVEISTFLAFFAGELQFLLRRDER